MKTVWVLTKTNVIACGDLMDGFSMLGIFLSKEAAFKAYPLEWVGDGEEYTHTEFYKGNSSCWTDYLLQKMEVEE